MADRETTTPAGFAVAASLTGGTTSTDTWAVGIGSLFASCLLLLIWFKRSRYL